MVKWFLLGFLNFVFWSYASRTNAAPQGMNEVSLFQKGYEEFQDQSYDEAIEFFSQALKSSQILGDYLHFYRAQAYVEKRQWRDAMADLQSIEAPEAHFKLLLDSRLLLAQVHFQLNQPAQVKPLFVKLAKRVRRTEDEPKVLFVLAKAEKLSQAGKGCQYLKQLYTRFPADPQIKHWDADLDKNEFLGDPTGCEYSIDDFRSRMRALLWAGLDEKAYAEMVLVSGRLKAQDPLVSDQIRSQFYLQEGDTTKAYDLLKNHLSAGLHDPEFLLNFASTASRAGDNLIGSSAYAYVAEHFPHSKFGQKALFLSAIMSYQFQDYDGAELRLRKFIQLYPKSSLSKEAQWHLTWLDYLRGNYDDAIEGYQQLLKKNRRNKGAQGRLQYWLAMSYYRSGRLEKAYEIFLKLSQDNSQSFYNLAAQSRLNLTLNQSRSKSPFSVFYSRPTGFQSLSPAMGVEATSTEIIDPEEDETSFVIAEEEREQIEEETGTASATEETEAAENADQPTEFKSARLQSRFERAKILFSLGLSEWAKWENFEIEKKTKNKDYLRTLIQDYQKLEQFHRSSQIAHLRFAAERSRNGYLGAKSLWESAYPKAYRNLVEKWASKESVAEELVWAIMKQESQFKKEAISPVGALGLMQVMPMTGYKMSKLRSDSSFSPTQLLQPPKAIEMGAAYLKRLSKKMKDNYALVAAAYNAGPHRVDLWSKSFGHLDADEYIEHIPFAETRNYVKKVITNMQTYQELYKGKKDLIVDLNKPFDYEIKGPLSLREDWDPD